MELLEPDLLPPVGFDADRIQVIRPWEAVSIAGEVASRGGAPRPLPVEWWAARKLSRAVQLIEIRAETASDRATSRLRVIRPQSGAWPPHLSSGLGARYREAA